MSHLVIKYAPPLVSEMVKWHWVLAVGALKKETNNLGSTNVTKRHQCVRTSVKNLLGGSGGSWLE